MNKSLTIVSAVLAVIGLVLNVAMDFDNVYDMTLAALWGLTLIFALAGALLVGKKSAVATVSSTSSVPQRR